MCQHTCSIYTEHVFIHIYICLVYNIGHVSLMCEDTCMHIAYTEHLFIMCEYTCLVRARVLAWLLCSAPLSGRSLLPADPRTKTVRGLHIAAQLQPADLQTAAAGTLHAAHWLS